MVERIDATMKETVTSRRVLAKGAAAGGLAALFAAVGSGRVLADETTDTTVDPEDTTPDDAADTTPADGDTTSGDQIQPAGAKRSGQRARGKRGQGRRRQRRRG